MPPSVDPKAAVSGPATFLMVVGGLTIVFAGIMLILHAIGAGAGALGGGGGTMGVLSGGLGIVWDLIVIIGGAIVIFGGIKMKNLQNYGLAMTAAILALVPCTAGYCCILGLPAGIWALVILMKPEVKAAFGGGGTGGFPTV